MLSAPKLRTETPHYLWFLNPSDPSKGPTQDTVVYGDVILNLPAPKQIKKIHVQMVGRQTMYINDKYEQYDVLSKDMTLEPCKTGTLDAGEHRFRWTFVVSANSVPYERSPFGKTMHYVKTTIPGAGKFGSDLISTEPVALVANSNPFQEGAALGLDRVSESFHPILGPLRVHLFAKYMLVSGFLRFSLTLPALSQPVIIEKVSVILTMTVQMKSIANPEKQEKKEVRVPLWESQGDFPKQMREGEELNVSRQLRMPNDNIIRPSTPEWSTTGIRVSHRIDIIVRFCSRAEGEDGSSKELKTTYYPIISSCNCSIEVLQLPGYSEQKTVPVAGFTFRAQYPGDCLCTLPLSYTEQLYGITETDLGIDDQYGAERDRRPAWMDKTEEEQGREAIDDLIRR